MAENDHPLPEQTAPCGCFASPSYSLVTTKVLGMDAIYAEISLLICPVCGQNWLRYFFELEAFTASGRWYLGAIQPEQAACLTAEHARVALEGLSWYFYGGSYFGGRSGRRSGRILLDP